MTTNLEVVDFTGHQECKSRSKALLQESRHFTCRVQLSSESRQPEIIFGAKRGYCVPPSGHSDDLEISCDLDFFTQPLPVSGLQDTDRLYLSSGNGGLVRACPFREIGSGSFGNVRFWPLVEAFEAEGKVFGKRLKVAAHENSRQIRRPRIYGLEVETVIRALVVLLNLQQVVARLLRYLIASQTRTFATP